MDDNNLEYPKFCPIYIPIRKWTNIAIENLSLELYKSTRTYNGDIQKFSNGSHSNRKRKKGNENLHRRKECSGTKRRYESSAKKEYRF